MDNYKPEGRNNLSRHTFKKYCAKNGYRADGRRNVFFHNSGKWGFVIPNPSNSVRQFYDDCDGVVVHGVGVFSRSDLQIGEITRKTPDGLIARNAFYQPINGNLK
jgi:hypothetical protein